MNCLNNFKDNEIVERVQFMTENEEKMCTRCPNFIPIDASVYGCRKTISKMEGDMNEN